MGRSSTKMSAPEGGPMPRSFSATSSSSSSSSSASASASASASSANPSPPSANAQSFQHILFLHPIRLTLFTLLHALYAVLLLLSDAWNWTSPADAASQALAIGNAISASAGEALTPKAQAAATKETSSGSNAIQIPKHVALILQTPNTGLPPVHAAADDEQIPQDEQAQAYEEEAERLAVKSLRIEVRKVALWCDQLGVGALTVMDTGGLLAKAGLQGHPVEQQGSALQNGSAGLVNGASHLCIEGENWDEETISFEKATMRKRPRSRLRTGANGSSSHPGEDDECASTTALSSPNGHTTPSSSSFDFSTLSLRTRVLCPSEGENIFAQTAESFRLELDRKVDEALDRTRAAAGPKEGEEKESGAKVKGEQVDEDGWTEVHGRHDSFPQSEPDSIRAEMLEWIEGITVSRVDEALQEHDYIAEPDFLILHGVPKRAVQLYGFPAWAVRLTEIFHDPLADPRRPITLTTFVRAIKYYNSVQQRFGK